MSKHSKKTGLTKLQQAVLDRSYSKVDDLVKKKKESVFDTGSYYYKTKFSKHFVEIGNPSEYVEVMPIVMAYNLCPTMFNPLLNNHDCNQPNGSIDLLKHSIFNNDKKLFKLVIENKNFQDTFKNNSSSDILHFLGILDDLTIFNDILRNNMAESNFSKFILKDYGYEGRILETETNSIIHCAIGENWDVMKLNGLLQHNPNKDLDKAELFSFAVDKGNPTYIKKLLDWNMYERNVDDFVKITNVRVIEAIVEYDPDILKAKTSKSETLMKSAMDYKNNTLIKYLSEKGIKNTKDKKGIDIMEVFLPDIGKKEEDYKARKDNENINSLYELLSNTDLTTQNKIELAEEMVKEDQFIIDKLISSDKYIYHCFKTPFKRGYDNSLDPELVNFIMDNLQDKKIINDKELFSGTNLLDDLIQKELNYNRVCTETRFYTDQMQNITVIADVLIQNGAEVNAKDKFGWTILDKMSAKGDDHSPVVKLLLHGGEYNKQFSNHFNSEVVRKLSTAKLNQKEKSKSNAVDVMNGNRMKIEKLSN